MYVTVVLPFFSVLPKCIGAFDPIWDEFKNSDDSRFHFLIIVELPVSHQTAFHIVCCEQCNGAHISTHQQSDFTTMQFCKLVFKLHRCINNVVMDNVEK